MRLQIVLCEWMQESSGGYEWETIKRIRQTKEASSDRQRPDMEWNSSWYDRQVALSSEECSRIKHPLKIPNIPRYGTRTMRSIKKAPRRWSRHQQAYHTVENCAEVSWTVAQLNEATAKSNEVRGSGILKLRNQQAIDVYPVRHENQFVLWRRSDQRKKVRRIWRGKAKRPSDFRAPANGLCHRPQT